jgi:hypothetical protein
LQLDQILGVEIKEKKGGQTDKVLELKYAGTISLTALIYIVSPQKLSEQGFKEFVKKIQAEEVWTAIENEGMFKQKYRYF